MKHSNELQNSGSKNNLVNEGIFCDKPQLFSCYVELEVEGNFGSLSLSLSLTLSLVFSLFSRFLILSHVCSLSSSHVDLAVSFSVSLWPLCCEQLVLCVVLPNKAGVVLVLAVVVCVLGVWPLNV